MGKLIFVVEIVTLSSFTQVHDHFQQILLILLLLWFWKYLTVFIDFHQWTECPLIRIEMLCLFWFVC